MHLIYVCELCIAGIRFGGEGSSEMGPNSNPSTWDYQLAQVQPVLLNKQDDTSFSLANTAAKNFSRRVQITTVGGKGSIRIKVECANQTSCSQDYTGMSPDGRTVATAYQKDQCANHFMVLAPLQPLSALHFQCVFSKRICNLSTEQPGLHCRVQSQNRTLAT